MTKPVAQRVQQRPADLHPLIRELYQRCVDSGMLMTELAAEVGVSTSTLYNWFRGRGAPDLVKLDALLRVIGYRFEIVRGVNRKNGN